MKKLLLFLLPCLMLTCFAGCKPGDGNPPTYEIKFMVDGELYQTVTTDDDGKITMPSDPTVDSNFTFNGWYTDDGVWANPVTSETKFTANTNVYAKVTRNIYEVKFYVNGNLFKTVNSNAEGTITLPANPSINSNYTFDGWFTDNNVWSNPMTNETQINGNTDVYAKITRKIYEVKFYANGSLYQTLSTDGDGKIIMPADPTVEQNFTFYGWFTDDEVWANPFTANTPINGNVDVYAKITRNTYTVKFMVNGEEYRTVATGRKGTITFPSNPTVGGNFSFDGWFTDDGVWENQFTKNTPINSSLTVYAKITRVAYSIKLVADGEVYQMVYTDANGNFTMPQDPNLGCGYVFNGWYTDDGTWENEFTNDPITDDVTVYAKLDKYVLNSLNATVETLNIGSKVWSTNDYVFTSLPKAFIGKKYLLWSINGYNEAVAIKDGWVYAITGEALDFGTNNSQMEKFDGYNFTLLDTAFWNLWSAALKNNFIYEKYVEKGETFTLGRWSVLIMSDTKLDIYKDEPIPTDDKLAVLKPSGTDYVGNMALKSLVFSDRAQYTFYDMPYWLAGKNYIVNKYDASSHTATVTKGGEVYMLTSKGGNISIVSSLVSAGWTDVTSTIPADLNIFGDATQNGAYLNSPYNGFALLKKQFAVGETVTWGKWGIPIFSGEFVISDNVAKLAPAVSTSYPTKVENGMRLFSDRTYYAMNGVPTGLEGLTYFMDNIESGATVKATTAGIAYLLIPSGTNAYKTLEQQVKDAGWELVPHRPVRLAVGQLFGNRMYSKYVEKDEVINFAKYNIIFGAPLDSEDDYYVMPSVKTAADVIVNPVGDFYDIDLQNWLGCPTIEKTAGGRVWAGWFTGGKNELGTGNYAIIYSSDDNCNTWKQAVAVVHPDTAVQVTKPELWVAPNGDLWLFWIQHTGTGNFDGKMGTWASVCTNPDDQNPTWSTPKRLTDGYMRSKPIIIDDNGTTTWLYAAFDWMEPHYTRVYASTDNGATWAFRGRAECIDTSSGKNNLDDPVLVQKPDGTLWLLVRPSAGTTVYESFSTDGGFTWTHARQSKITGPQSRFTIDLLDDGKMLMVYHDSTSRERLTAYLSLDGGDTWAYTLLLDDRGGVSYPDTIITSSGAIYVIYDRNRTSDREIWMTVFTLDDLIAGRYTTSISRHKVLVDKTNPK